MASELKQGTTGEPSFVGKLFVILMLPVGLLFMLGDVLAAPFEKHRHANIYIWLVWHFLRMSVPVGIIVYCILYFINKD